jgi:hypothetical protein
VASAVVDRLRLVRDSATSKEWRLAAGEGTRTATMAGIDLDQPRREREAFLHRVLITVGVLAGLAILAVLLWIIARRGRSAATAGSP